MEDMTRRGEDEAIDRLDGFADEAGRLDPDALTSSERVSRGVLIHEARAQAAEPGSRLAELSVSSVMGLRRRSPYKRQIGAGRPIVFP